MGGVTCSREAISKFSQLAPAVPVPVMLHIYDIGCLGAGGLNSILGTVAGTGAFHCGVEVHSAEWSFGEVLAHDQAITGVTGVFTCRPTMCKGHTYSRTVDMGLTSASHLELMQLIQVLEQEWKAELYDLISCNCCHFCNELCHRLRVGGIPKWVNRLAVAGDLVESSVGEISSLRCCQAIAGEAMQSTCQAEQCSSVRCCRRGNGDEVEISTAEEAQIHYLL